MTFASRCPQSRQHWRSILSILAVLLLLLLGPRCMAIDPSIHQVGMDWIGWVTPFISEINCYPRPNRVCRVTCKTSYPCCVTKLLLLLFRHQRNPKLPNFHHPSLPYIHTRNINIVNGHKEFNKDFFGVKIILILRNQKIDFDF